MPGQARVLRRQHDPRRLPAKALFDQAHDRAGQVGRDPSADVERHPVDGTRHDRYAPADDRVVEAFGRPSRIVDAGDLVGEGLHEGPTLGVADEPGQSAPLPAGRARLDGVGGIEQPGGDRHGVLGQRRVVGPVDRVELRRSESAPTASIPSR